MSEPRSRRPKSLPSAMSTGKIDLIVRLRRELTGQGLDAQRHTITWHLEHNRQVPAPMRAGSIPDALRYHVGAGRGDGTTGGVARIKPAWKIGRTARLMSCGNTKPGRRRAITRK